MYTDSFWRLTIFYLLIWTFLKGHTIIISTSVFFKRIGEVVISLRKVLVYTFPCAPWRNIKCLYVHSLIRSCIPSKWLFLSSRFTCMSLAPSFCNSKCHPFAYYEWGSDHSWCPLRYVEPMTMVYTHDLFLSKFFYITEIPVTSEEWVTMY